MSAGSYQTLTLEYRVYDLCDGTTEAPPFSDGELDDRQIYVFEVQRLGVIPLRFGDEVVNPENPSAPANRVITWALLTGVPTAFSETSGLSVGLSFLGQSTMPVERVGQISVSSDGLYVRRCIKVPQGGVLLVRGIEAPPTGPAIIRLRVQQAENGEQQHQLELACCCKETMGNINVPDSVTTACPSDLSLDSLDPNETEINAMDPVTVTLTGAGFASLQEIYVTFEDLPVYNIQLIDDNTVTVEVLPNLSGLFTVMIGDPNIETCFATLQDSFRVSE